MIPGFSFGGGNSASSGSNAGDVSGSLANALNQDFSINVGKSGKIDNSMVIIGGIIVVGLLVGIKLLK